MHPTLKKIIAAALSLFVLFVGFYGSYLPLRKSRLFIGTMRGMGNTASLAELKRQFSIPLDATSPVGQEELVRNTANFLVSAFQQPNIKPEVALDILKFIENYYDPIISSDRGMSFTQDLYVSGILNELAFTKTKNPEYLEKAQVYFERGLEKSPHRPQFLFGMFDIFHIKGDVEGMKKIANQIFSLWPEETRTSEAIKEIIASFGAPAKKH